MLTIFRMLVKMLLYPIYQRCKEPFNYKIVKRKEQFPKLHVKIRCSGDKDLSIERTKRQNFKATLYNGFRANDRKTTYTQSNFGSHQYECDNLPFFLALVSSYNLHNNIKDLNYMLTVFDDERIRLIKKIFNLLLSSQKKYILNHLRHGENSPLSYPSSDSIEAKLGGYDELISNKD